MPIMWSQRAIMLSVAGNSKEKVILSPGTPDHKKSGGQRRGRYIESPLRNAG